MPESDPVDRAPGIRQRLPDPDMPQRRRRRTPDPTDDETGTDDDAFAAAFSVTLSEDARRTQGPDDLPHRAGHHQSGALQAGRAASYPALREAGGGVWHRILLAIANLLVRLDVAAVEKAIDAEPAERRRYARFSAPTTTVRVGRSDYDLYDISLSGFTFGPDNGQLIDRQRFYFEIRHEGDGEILSFKADAQVVRVRRNQIAARFFQPLPATRRLVTQIVQDARRRERL